MSTSEPRISQPDGHGSDPIVCWRCKGTGHDSDNDRACRSCHGRGTRYDNVHQLHVSPQAQAMISACWTLGGLPELEELRLRPWTHVLGFPGHFSAKSRRYSTTLSCLREARQQWRNQRVVAALGYPDHTRMQRHGPGDPAREAEDQETILVIGQWQYRGRGHSGEAIYARTIAHELAESRRIGRQMKALEDRYASR